MDIDRQLVERFRDGDPAAFRSVFRAAVNDVYWFAYRMTGNEMEAEDVVQETFLRIYRMRREIDPNRPFRLLILRIATNVAIDTLRKDRRLNRVGRHGGSGSGPEATSAFQLSGEGAQIDRITLEQALVELPPIYRSVLVLKYAHDLSYQEIAQACGISVPAVALRIKRGKEALRRRLAATAEGEAPA